jgi:hypothetical protein
MAHPTALRSFRNRSLSEGVDIGAALLRNFHQRAMKSNRRCAGPRPFGDRAGAGADWLGIVYHNEKSEFNLSAFIIFVGGRDKAAAP